MRVAVRFLAFSALAMLLAVGASAQLAKGFRGRVYDQNGKPVAGVPVVFEDLANSANHYEIKTEANGEFAQMGLSYSAAGYKISASIPNFPTMTKTEVARLMELVEVNFDPRKGLGFAGTVKDKAGQPVSGAKITIVNLADESKPYTEKTDGKGQYRRVDLPYTEKGYKLICEIPGEQPMTKTVGVQQIAVLDGSFTVGATQETAQGGPPASSKASDAKAMFELGDYEGALGKADEAIAANDNANIAKLIKATCLARLDRTDEAIAAFEDYNKDNPGDVNILGELYKLYEKKGDKAKTDQYRKEFVAKGGQISGQTYNDGVNALNAGNAQKAAELFKQAVKENATDPDAHRELARCYAQMGKFQETVDELQIYLKMKPNAEDASTWKSAIQGLEQAIQQQHKK
jgi:tetratricopeptide (TPR) repeat protein